MNIKTGIGLVISHAIMAIGGFAAGFYTLPILTAPPAPAAELVSELASKSQYSASFSRERTDSDALHWGEGRLAIGDDTVSFMGKLAPGPDYRLYFSPQFVETEAEFNRIKSSMVEAGPVTTFDNFVVELPDGIDPSQYQAVIVWCEAFGQFITSGKYQ